MAAKRYMVTAYQRYSANDDQVKSHRTGVGAKAAAKLAVKMARMKGVDAGVAVRVEEFDRHRVGQVTSVGAYGNNPLMVCRGDDPYGSIRGKKKRQIVKCEIKSPEFKAEIRAGRKRR